MCDVLVRKAWRRLSTACFCFAVCAALVDTVQAQFLRVGAVGGVKVDVNGVISHPQEGDSRQLQQTWQAGLEQVPAQLDKPTELRFVSLRRLEEHARQALQNDQPLPDAARYLAGLLRVRYVLVYPEQNDIVLAGPAEGWRVNSLGSVVGKSSGRPVLTLVDLIVALRVAESSNMTGISCSIDPTPEGLQRMQEISGQLPPNPRLAGPMMEQAAGNQKITVTGVPASSHLARVLVAADFRMKRLAMAFEPAPVGGLPSFMDLISNRRSYPKNWMPRWWLAPNYEPIRRDEQGLAWELRGQGVKCLTEEQFVADGKVQRTGGANPNAQKWADAFTEHFDELSREDSAFGELRNVMDLAVVASLIAKERLLERSGLEIPRLQQDVTIEEFYAPRWVASQASFVRALGGRVIMSVSGGVQIFPWLVADRTEVDSDLSRARPQGNGAGQTTWYWQR